MFIFKSKKQKTSSVVLSGDINILSEQYQKNPLESSKEFNQLLSYLTHPIPEKRIAACNALSKTSSDVAFTNISHWFRSETDENVIQAMKKAMISIRKNMNENKTEI